VFVDDEDLPSRRGIDGANGIEELCDGVSERDNGRRESDITVSDESDERGHASEQFKPVEVLSLVSSSATHGYLRPNYCSIMVSYLRIHNYADTSNQPCHKPRH
jgi:hypothetical protein